MSGLRSICIGRSGCGKTTLTKEMLNRRPKEMPCMVYDINNEYQDYYPERFEDFDVFLSRLTDRDSDGKDIVKHFYIVIEEATIFFNTHSNFEDMKNVLVRARHTGNIIQLNFHSFSSIPKGIYNLLDYVIIFKTNDNEKSITDRFDNPKVLEAAREVRQSDDPHIYRTVKLY
jgi:phospholipid N-methyltransferase